MTPDQEERCLRLRALVAAELAKDGLRPSAGWTVVMTANGTLCVHDPAEDEGTAPSRIRAGIRIDGADRASDTLLVGPMTAQAKGALRRSRTVVERRRSEHETGHATGWSVMLHPLAAAMCRAAGLPAEHAPPRRLAGEHPRDRSGFTLSTATTQDLVNVTLETVAPAGGKAVKARLESKPGLTTLSVAFQLPETALAALPGRPLSHLLDARCGDPRIDEALSGVIVSDVRSEIRALNPAMSSVEPHVVVTTAPAAWIPWDRPPEEVARLVALSPEVH